MNRATANLLLLVTGAIWGGGFVAQSTAMESIGPVFFTGIRFLAAAIAVLPLALWEARSAPVGEKPLPFPRYLLLGSILFASLLTQQIGLLTTTVTNSGFLTGTYVVLVPLVSVIIFRQMPHFIVWPAALAILVGIYMLSGGALTSLQPGDLLTMLCALFWAFHVMLVGRTVQGSGRPFALACTQFFTVAALGLVIAPFFETVDIASVRAAAPEILFAGVISGGVAFTLQVIAQRHTTPPQAAIFMSSEALFAALLGALILGERVGPLGLAGCLLIFSAILAVELVPMWRPKRANDAAHEMRH